MATFLTSWTKTIKDIENCSKKCKTFELIKEHLLEVLSSALSALSERESFFTTQFDTCCIGALPKEHEQNVMELLKTIEDTEIFKFAETWIKDFDQNNQNNPSQAQDVEDSDAICKRGKNCCPLQRIGKTVKTEEQHENEKCIQSLCKKRMESEKHCLDNGHEELVKESHFITMLFLSWPYNYTTPEKELTGRKCLSKYIEKTIENGSEILQNEVRCLQLQIMSLLSMLENNKN